MGSRPQKLGHARHFALGFVLTFVFFTVGAIIAPIVAYRQRSTVSGKDRVDLLK